MVEIAPENVLGFVCRDGKVLLPRPNKNGSTQCRMGVIGPITAPYLTPAAALEYQCRVQLGIEPLRSCQVAEQVYLGPRTDRQLPKVSYLVKVFVVSMFDGELRSTRYLEDLAWFDIENLPMHELSRIDRLTLLPSLAKRGKKYVFSDDGTLTTVQSFKPG